MPCLSTRYYISVSGKILYMSTDREEDNVIAHSVCCTWAGRMPGRRGSRWQPRPALCAGGGGVRDGKSLRWSPAMIRAECIKDKICHCRYVGNLGKNT